MLTSFLDSNFTGTTDILSPLRARNASGFRNVYLSRFNSNGAALWVARVKRGRDLRELRGSRSTDPHVCAMHVLRWYRHEFGRNWLQALKARKSTPYVVKWSPTYRGYRVAVWVEGRREEVVKLRRLPLRWGHDRWARVVDMLEVFPTRAEAVLGMHRYLSRLYGLFVDAILYRLA